MKILRAQVQGFKRIVMLDVTPEGAVVDVRGNNAEGKTSLLDSIMATLGGAGASPIKPIRTGDDFAAIRLTLGDGKPDLIVTKYFDEVGEKLRVENAEGAEWKAGQTKVDELLGRMTFDPLELARMKPAGQVAELRRFLPAEIDLDAMAKLDTADTTARRDVNRDAKALKARIDAIEVSGIVPERPDREGIALALSTAGETNAAIEQERRARETVRNAIAEDEAVCDRWTAEAADLRRRADHLDAQVVEHRESSANLKARLDEKPPLAELVDTAQLSADLAAADRDLALLGRIDARAALEQQFEAMRTTSEGFTTALATRAAERSKALAEAVMPVPGLALARLCDAVPTETAEDLIVMFEGEPFAQASAAQQLRVSMRLAMAANPRLRVMLIRDGSLLDTNGRELVEGLAEAGGYQVWLESVGEGDGSGIIMEAGAVRGAPEPERLDGPKRRKAKPAEAEGAAQNDTDGAAEEAAIKTAVDDAIKDGVVAGMTTVAQAAGVTPPARRKPTAMREFTSTPVGDDLFGGK